METLDAESLWVGKLLFVRPKDLVDIVEILTPQGETLDRGFIPGWIEALLGKDDERLTEWDHIRCPGHQASTTAARGSSTLNVNETAR